MLTLQEKFKILVSNGNIIRREYFRAGEFWNLDTSINIRLQHEKESREKKQKSFAWNL